MAGRATPAVRPFLDALDQGRAAHACWQALPGEDWPARLAEAAVTAAAAGRGALLVLPDYRDTARVHAAVAELAGLGAVVTLADELGHAERYRRWLAVRRSAAHRGAAGGHAGSPINAATLRAAAGGMPVRAATMAAA